MGTIKERESGVISSDYKQSDETAEKHKTQTQTMKGKEDDAKSDVDNKGDETHKKQTQGMKPIDEISTTETHKTQTKIEEEKEHVDKPPVIEPEKETPETHK